MTVEGWEYLGLALFAVVPWVLFIIMYLERKAIERQLDK